MVGRALGAANKGIMINIVDFGDGDYQMELFNAQLGRKILVGSDWTQLRIGVRLNFIDLGLNPGTIFFCLGACAAPTTGFANGPIGTGAHFIGAATERSGSSDFTRSTWPTYDGGLWPTRIQDGTRVVATGTTMRFSASTTVRHCVFVDLTKSGSNMLVSMVVPHPTSAEAAVMKDLSNTTYMIGAMESGALTSAPVTFLNTYLGATTYLGTSAQTLARDEVTYGALDSVCVAWNRNAFACRVSDLMWIKIS